VEARDRQQLLYRARRRRHDEIARHRFDWETNDIFVIRTSCGDATINKGPGDAVLYLCSDRPLFEKIGHTAPRAAPPSAVVQLVS